jgi:protein-L-isoaspartate(D-aspartate) O-methyltransferase
MDRPMMDTAAARNMMVDSQVRPNKVYDPRIIEAMRRLPRERFLPPALAARAYADEDVSLGNGRALMEPMVIARLVQMAAVRVGERALVVAAGTGYGAALLAACGAQVTVLEDDEALLGIARSALAGTQDVTLVSGPLVEGWPKAAPFDVVLIEGAVEEVPTVIAAQVRPQGGRLVTVRRAANGLCQGVLAEPSVGGLSFQAVFDCATPKLPAFARAPGFVF